jgi:porphobilinogen synthase
MPGQFLYSVDALAPVVDQLAARQVNTVLLFGQAVSKDACGHSAYAHDNTVLKAIAMLKKLNPALTVITDVCLCSYTDHGHCGPLKSVHGQRLMDNAKTLEIISTMALRHAEAGADIVAPSGMVDGMVGAIRATMDEHDLDHVAILSYAAKYASGFYGPFREASDCSPKQGDRRGYQMNPANRKEAVLEAALDVEEGADILMVKPALPYLDIISDLAGHFDVPVFAYQVSGEYSMIKAAAQNGWIDEQSVVRESLLAMKRAGAQAIISYFALSIDLDSL